MEDNQQEPMPSPVQKADLNATNSQVPSSLIKSPEELITEAIKKNKARLKLMVFLGTIIVMIIVSAYVLKSGKQLQGNLGNVSQGTTSSTPEPEVSSVATVDFCSLNQYRDENTNECIGIPKNDCDVVERLKQAPVKYGIDANTIKQDWWQEDCVPFEEQDPVAEEETKIVEPVLDEDIIASDIEQPDVNQPLDCGKAKADASIYTDKGFINQAYESQVSQLTEDLCHPEYGTCEERLASAVAAQAYMTFAESIRKSIVSLRSEFDKNADAFYADPACYDTVAECTRIKTTGLSSEPTETEELPLSLIAPAAIEEASSSVVPVSGGSPFSQDALELSIEKAIKDGTIFTEKEFYERYCAPKPTPSSTTQVTEESAELPPEIEPAVEPAPVKVKRAG